MDHLKEPLLGLKVVEPRASEEESTRGDDRDHEEPRSNNKMNHAKRSPSGAWRAIATYMLCHALALLLAFSITASFPSSRQDDQHPTTDRTFQIGLYMTVVIFITTVTIFRWSIRQILESNDENPCTRRFAARIKHLPEACSAAVFIILMGTGNARLAFRTLSVELQLLDILVLILAELASRSTAKEEPENENDEPKDCYSTATSDMEQNMLAVQVV